MRKVIEARSLVRRFGDRRAVDGIDLAIDAGSIVGLIGPNGAGKTTLLRALLGLTAVEGSVRVLGCDPARERAALMEQVCFIADTAVLPKWMRVRELLDFVAGVHPNFDQGRACEFLERTEVRPDSRIRELSKGMNVQVHLAVAMAIDARVLILDEPTLGLDILFRKRFFEQLLNDYFDEERTIIISTHQVEEVEHILSHVVFMDHGRIVLEQAMDSLAQRYVELHAVGEALATAREIAHVGSRNILGGRALIYEDVPRARLASLGELRTPSISDLFVAKVGGGRS